MKAQILPFMFLLLLLNLLSSCGENTKENNGGPVVQYTKESYFERPSGGQIIKWGSPLQIQLDLRNEIADLESVVFFIDGKEVFKSGPNGKSYSFEWTDSLTTCGSHQLESVLTKKDGKTESNSTTFVIISDQAPKFYTYSINASFPHHIQAYTQGLVIDNGKLYEGTGLNGKSELRLVDLRTGNPLRSKALENQYFGEGITALNGKIYQLTYRSKVGFVYDQNTFEQVNQFSYSTEGWGLTTDGESLIFSDGSSQLYFLDPETFQIKKKIGVCDDQGAVVMINELEYINGEIWANIYQSEGIVRIDPATGKVTGKIDMRGLLKAEEMHPSIDVLNGIAYDKATGKIYVTGKNWPKLFEISLTEKSGS